eukprot:gene24579-26431_t
MRMRMGKEAPSPPPYHQGKGEKVMVRRVAIREDEDENSGLWVRKSLSKDGLPEARDWDYCTDNQCSAFFLRGSCSRGDDCELGHASFEELGQEVRDERGGDKKRILEKDVVEGVLQVHPVSRFICGEYTKLGRCRLKPDGEACTRGLHKELACNKYSIPPTAWDRVQGIMGDIMDKRKAQRIREQAEDAKRRAQEAADEARAAAQLAAAEERRREDEIMTAQGLRQRLLDVTEGVELPEGMREKMVASALHAQANVEDATYREVLRSAQSLVRI